MRRTKEVTLRTYGPLGADVGAVIEVPVTPEGRLPPSLVRALTPYGDLRLDDAVTEHTLYLSRRPATAGVGTAWEYRMLLPGEKQP